MAQTKNSTPKSKAKKKKKVRVAKKKIVKKGRDNNVNNNNNGGLTVKETLFVKEYLMDFNATRAYMRVYDNAQTCESASVQSCKLLRNNKVLKFEIDKQIRDRMMRLDVKNDMIVAQLKGWVMMDLRQFYNENETFKSIHELNILQQSFIDGIETEELYEGQGRDRRHIGRMKRIKFVNRLEAKRTLMKYFKMLIDKSESTLDIKQSLSLRLEVEKLKELSDNDLDCIETILERGEKKPTLVGCSEGKEGRKTPN